eukprot:9482825-Pyramimonas_sp.AAC.1
MRTHQRASYPASAEYPKVAIVLLGVRSRGALRIQICAVEARCTVDAARCTVDAARCTVDATRTRCTAQSTPRS